MVLFDVVPSIYATVWYEMLSLLFAILTKDDVKTGNFQRSIFVRFVPPKSTSCTYKLTHWGSNIHYQATIGVIAAIYVVSSWFWLLCIGLRGLPSETTYYIIIPKIVVHWFVLKIPQNDIFLKFLPPRLPSFDYRLT